jgi:hypothetical protein
MSIPILVSKGVTCQIFVGPAGIVVGPTAHRLPALVHPVVSPDSKPAFTKLAAFANDVVTSKKRLIIPSTFFIIPSFLV